ncbi:ATP-binding protein [Candidatus Phytoplasma melaleucae]|uniref:AAA family ATPase n=1 Tax=Candidatus Phytoplasma melaleucae TaxID=2982630 RepID=UPI0031DFE63E
MLFGCFFVWSLTRKYERYFHNLEKMPKELFLEYDVDKALQDICDEKFQNITKELKTQYESEKKIDDSQKEKIANEGENSGSNVSLKSQAQDYTLLQDTKFKPKEKAKLPEYDNLIGMKTEKKALENFLHYIQKPYCYQGLGEIKPPQGVIFYGCSGTGKTFLARALAKKAGDNISYYELAAPDFSCSYVGEGPQKVRDLFQDVRLNNKRANINGSIIFLDECEQIFKDLSKNSENNSKDLANIVNQFKVELTSTENDPTKPILIIGATNYYDQLDEAIKSRFDYHIEVKPGNQQEREDFLKLRIKQRKNKYHDNALNYLLNEVNAEIERFASSPKTFFMLSNRQLEKLLNSIISKTAKNERKMVTIEDVEDAFKEVYAV